MSARDLTQDSYTGRIWRHFNENAFARNGLRVIVFLFILAALAPFLANNHAIIRVSDGAVTFPVFRSMELIEWRFLIYVPLAAAFYFFRAYIFRIPRVDLSLLALLCAAAGTVASLMPLRIALDLPNFGAAREGYVATTTIGAEVSPAFWIIVLFGMVFAFALRNRKQIVRWPQPSLLYIPLIILILESVFSFWHPVNDPTNDRDRAASFKLMPPIAWSPTESSSDQFSPPTWRHLCGTDSTGRDIAARMIHGARTSLSIGFIAQSISLLVGVTLGGLAGYYKGWLDVVVGRVIEIMDCFPPLLLILVAISLFQSQNNMFYIMAVIGLTSWTGLARLVRGEFLRLGSMQFPQASRALGAGDSRIFLRHLLPNALGPILVSATFGVASAILLESSLSFLGFGMQAPTPSWGDILSDARRYIDFAWWLAFFPGVAILLTLVSYNFVGEGLRDAVDPRLKVK